MTFKRTIAFFAASALLPLFACAFVYASDNSVERQVLDNGLTIIVKEVPGAEIESLRIFVKTGSSTEGRFAGSGISHFTEHIIFKGTKSRPVGRIQEDIKAIGGYMNAATSYDYTDFEVDVPAEKFYEGTDILLDAVINPVFDKREMKKERDVILREIKMGEDDPDRFFSNLVWSNVYTVHPYRYPVIGFQDLFEKLTVDDLKKYHDKKYTPNNMVFIAVGPVKQPQIFPLVKSYFKDIKMGWQDTTILPQEPQQPAVKEISEKARVSLTRLALCYKTISVNSEDIFPLDVLSIILGHGNSSRLYKKLKEETDLVYSVDSFNYTPKYLGFFGIMCILDKEKEFQARKIILDAIKQMKNTAPSAAELAKAKKQVLSDYLFNLESVEGQAEDIATDEVICSDVNFSKKYIAGINSVSGKDIQRVANKYLNENNLTVVSLEPVVGATRRVAPTVVIGNSVIKKFTLKNGIRLLVKEDHNLPIVSVNVCMPGGLRVESEENNGISALMSNMLTKGTKSRTAGQIALFFDSRGAMLHAYSGNNAFGLSMKVLSQDLNESLEVLSDCLSNPSFDKKEFQKEKERVLAGLRDEKDDIFAVSGRAMKATLFKVNPFRFQPQGTEESVDSISQKEVADFYYKNFNAGNMVISVFGDIKTEDVVKKIESNFSKLKSTGRDILKEKVPAEPVFKVTRELTKTAAKEQAVIILGFLGPTIYDKDRYVFDIINSMLSGEKGRLFTEIREKGAMAYATGSYTVEGIETGYFMAYAATSQKSLGRAKTKMMEQLKLLCKKPLNEKELRAAKEELVGREKMDLQTETSLSFVTSLDELYGLGYDDYTKYDANVRAVTAQDVLRVANKYLNTDGFACVSILPEQ